MKRIIYCLFFFASFSCINAQVNKKSYLQKVLNNLEQIKSASYYITSETWQPGDTTALSTFRNFVKEYDNPKDTTIGACFVDLDPNDTTKLDFCYDGDKRVLVYHDVKGIVIDDFTARPLPFRPLRPPFFNYTKNIIKYALETTDNITTKLEDRNDHYHFKMVINEDKQVEFLGKAYHMPEAPFFSDPTSIYELWISKSSNLPYKVRREMSHDISAMTCSDITLNRLSIANFKAVNYYPKGYEIRKYGYRNAKEKTIPPLTGKEAPEWTLTDKNGKSVSLHDIKSKVVLINFTGIGCGACLASLPFLKALKGEFSNTDFELVAIESWARKARALDNYIHRKGINYTMLNATDQVIKDYQTGGTAPFFFILDQQRIVRKVIRGYGGKTTDHEILEAIKHLL